VVIMRTTMIVARGGDELPVPQYGNGDDRCLDDCA
jgi:hypothetical protein